MQGCVPDDWKLANVAPIFKKGDRGKASNYRPVSLTCISCKLLEHIVSSNVMSHLEAHDILTDAQHGFRRRRSCETQLILTVQDSAQGIEDKQQIDVILLDFSKAFDKVPHRRLLHKLGYYGVRGLFVCWSLTSLCHSNGHIETMPAREINPFTALTRIRTQVSQDTMIDEQSQRVDTTTH